MFVVPCELPSTGADHCKAILKIQQMFLTVCLLPIMGLTTICGRQSGHFV